MCLNWDRCSRSHGLRWWSSSHRLIPLWRKHLLLLFHYWLWMHLSSSVHWGWWRWSDIVSSRRHHHVSWIHDILLNLILFWQRWCSNNRRWPPDRWWTSISRWWLNSMMGRWWRSSFFLNRYIGWVEYCRRVCLHVIRVVQTKRWTMMWQAWRICMNRVVQARVRKDSIPSLLLLSSRGWRVFSYSLVRITKVCNNLRSINWRRRSMHRSRMLLLLMLLLDRRLNLLMAYIHLVWCHCHLMLLLLFLLIVPTLLASWASNLLLLLMLDLLHLLSLRLLWSSSGLLLLINRHLNSNLFDFKCSLDNTKCSCNISSCVRSLNSMPKHCNLWRFRVCQFCILHCKILQVFVRHILSKIYKYLI